MALDNLSTFHATTDPNESLIGTVKHQLYWKLKFYWPISPICIFFIRRHPIALTVTDNEQFVLRKLIVRTLRQRWNRNKSNIRGTAKSNDEKCLRDDSSNRFFLPSRSERVRFANTAEPSKSEIHVNALHVKWFTTFYPTAWPSSLQSPSVDVGDWES